MTRLIVVIALVLAYTPAWAHKPSDSYLSLTVRGAEVVGRWDIALRDLDYAVGLDSDDDGGITWGEVKRKQQDIAAYAFSHLSLASGTTACSVRPSDQLIDNHTDGAYAVLQFTAACPTPAEALSIDYRLLFDLDAQHKGLLRLTQAGTTLTAIFSQTSPTQSFRVGTASVWEQVLQYLSEGVWHIWVGVDHLLFLLALLLPAVLIKVERRWEAVSHFQSALREVVSIVTAFTVAHSITLSLATVGLVQLPSRLVESTIASSVIAAAVANLAPIAEGRRRWMAFGFGLIHGFGFATVLTDLGLPPQSLTVSLFSFNLGVEVGQLAVVACFLPMAFWCRRSRVYQQVVLAGGSALIAGLASVWFVERVFNLQFRFF